MAGNTSGIDKDLLALLERPKTNRAGAVITKGKKDEPVMRSIGPDEVLSYAESAERVTVVTTDGRKFSAEIPEKLRKARAAAAAAAARAAAPTTPPPASPAGGAGDANAGG